jgi:hypothetical protein
MRSSLDCSSWLIYISRSTLFATHKYLQIQALAQGRLRRTLLLLHSRVCFAVCLGRRNGSFRGSQRSFLGSRTQISKFGGCMSGLAILKHKWVILIWKTQFKHIIGFLLVRGRRCWFNWLFGGLLELWLRSRFYWCPIWSNFRHFLLDHRLRCALIGPRGCWFLMFNQLFLQPFLLVLNDCFPKSPLIQLEEVLNTMLF